MLNSKWAHFSILSHPNLLFVVTGDPPEMKLDLDFQEAKNEPQDPLDTSSIAAGIVMQLFSVL